jgi:hypothetical protein
MSETQIIRKFERHHVAACKDLEIEKAYRLHRDLSERSQR